MEKGVGNQGIDAVRPDCIPKQGRHGLYVIVFTLCVISFLAAFDNIILSSNLPLAANEFNGFNLYGWANTAFLLTASTAQPLYGKYVNVFGRRWCLAFATSSYIVGAAVCSAAQSMVMLIVARALCGLGVGAFDSLMKIVIADHIPLRFIGSYQALLGISWGLGYIVGALLGGYAVAQTTWRTVFWMSLGVAVFATVLVLICIRSKDDVAASLHQQVKNTDAIGIFIWIAGIVMFVLALSWGGTTYAWNSAVIISLLCISIVLLILFAFWERWGAKEPIIPRNTFSNRSSIFIVIVGFLYGGTFQSLMTYVPLYLSLIRREDSMATNLELLCLVLFACIANVSVGLVIVRTGKYTWAIRLSLAILVLACGVLDLLDTQSGRGTIVGLMIVTGIGSGGIINSEIVTAQASVAIEHVPPIISLMTLADLSGGITGITVQGTILSNRLASLVQHMNVSASDVRQSSSYIYSLPEPTQSMVLEAYMDAVRKSFWGSFGFAAAALVASLAIKSYTMRTHLA